MLASGIALVDKPQGVTSHDVVARARRAFGTRKVGHAGTLDPMATGLLLVGVEGATRLLTYLVGLDKTYLATIRLGEATSTDDAEGETTSRADAGALEESRIRDGIAALTGTIEQVPSSVSAIKVQGRRAYDLVRAGEQVELKARAVTVSRFELREIRRGSATIDLDVEVDCSSGTYIRALARDLGAALGVGGHLTALRRTRVGSFEVGEATSWETLVALAESRGSASRGPSSSAARDPSAEDRDPARGGSAAADPDTAGSSATEDRDPTADSDAARILLPAAEVAARVLGALAVDAEEARDLRHGKRLVGAAGRIPGRLAAAIDPDGALVGVVERRGEDLKSAMNMPEARG